MTGPVTAFLCPCCARRPRGPRRDWCKNELAELKRRYAFGDPVEDIAKALGRSVKAVRQAALDNDVRRALRAPRRTRCPSCGELIGPSGTCALCDASEARP